MASLLTEYNISVSTYNDEAKALAEINTPWRLSKIKTISHVEQEVNQIRLKIYEETKDMTPAQRVERISKIGEAAAKKYGFKRVASAKENSL